MSHNLFGERFGDQRFNAWHELGQVFGEPISASKAYKRLGPYEVRLAPCTADGVDLEQQAILRNPTTDDPETRVFGTVGMDYHLITPEDFVSIWDERVGQPIETIGMLGFGETMFLTTYLPTLNVKGDEIEFYLLAKNPMTGLHAAEAMTTPVRTVCKNTLIAAEAAATQKLRIVHDEHGKTRMGDWLQEMYQEAETTAYALKEMFDVLAGFKVKAKDAELLFEEAYPYPNTPKRNAPARVMDQRLKWWSENVSLMDRRREGAQELFEGMGTGMDTVAAKGTLWGAYNAVVECEDYRRGKDEAKISTSILFGERADSKKRALKAALDIAGVK